ncbi:hypothetical protein CANARDRAFT_8938 [[Candida] arabinofermentans NRRL YB-2248]|uniref:CAP-Gly domain-containing protein n=1 Tax=[Candida] arabinofermentans NRRL YB-2248 TaxID=983967 RepID=A0A1E4SXN2_9ASCO|nr:hypothetical protein CANARDRAFT_8938 [[Candida] arabinofermentans NRRL YB-2248]
MSQLFNFQLSVGSRVQLNGNLATIRFIGDIPNWPKNKAYGLEWDDPTRGKNDGQLDGVKYFSTLGGLNSGSFVKDTKIKKEMDESRSVFDALCYQYSADVDMEGTDDSYTEEDEFDVTIGTKKVQSFGFEKLSRFQSNYKNLDVVSLGRLAVHNEIGSQHLGQLLTNLKELNIDFSLIDDWSVIVDTVSQLPTLIKLNINGNRFTHVTKTIEASTHLVKLSMASCMMAYYPQPLLESMIGTFTNLKVLNLAGNHFTNLEKLSYPLLGLMNLVELDLSYNCFESMDELTSFRKLRSLRNLNLSNNTISIHAVNDFELPTVSWLDLSSNNVTTWDEIDLIATQFPKLKAIKLTHNPLFLKAESTNNAQEDDLNLIRIISKLPNITKLNGTEYSQDQRNNFELYFVNKMKDGSWSYPTNTMSWKLLATKYNLSAISPKATLQKKSNHITLRIVPDELESAQGFDQSIFPETTTAGKLRGKISRRWNLSVLNFQIYYKVNETLKERINNDQQLLESFDFRDGDMIYVKMEDWQV